LTWFPRFHRVPEWFIEDRVRDGVLIPAHVWRETLHGLCNAEPPTDAATINAPTLIVWGERDQLLSREQQERLAGAIAGSRLLVYENTGHLVLWEQPDLVARDVTRFVGLLQRPPG
jgi:pimeloyl-ACP methyl ester carboxylesterase